MSAGRVARSVPRRPAAPLKFLVRLGFAALTRLRVEGQEHIPVEGGAVLVFNHLSNFDPPLFFALFRRPKVTALTADDYRKRTFHRFWIEAGGSLWITRGASDRAALTNAIALLQQGWIVGFAPEGRRSPTKALIMGKRGPAFLAMHANVPVLPAGLAGTERIGHALRRFRRATVTVRLGEPIMPPPLQGANHRQQQQAFTDAIMGRIATLVPAEYRGVYADHPALGASRRMEDAPAQ